MRKLSLITFKVNKEISKINQLQHTHKLLNKEPSEKSFLNNIYAGLSITSIIINIGK